jgi:hypothetical protein
MINMRVSAFTINYKRFAWNNGLMQNEKGLALAGPLVFKEMIDKVCGKEEPGGCDTSIKEDVLIALLG